MKIHTDILTHEDIADATRAGGMRGVYTERESVRGSRSRARSFDITLRGNSTRRPNGGNRGADDGYAATWDEWGMFIQALFEKDPEAIIGQYRSFDDFEMATHGRFESLTAPYAHGNHTWIVNTAGTQECKFCEAAFSHIR